MLQSHPSALHSALQTAEELIANSINTDEMRQPGTSASSNGDITAVKGGQGNLTVGSNVDDGSFIHSSSVGAATDIQLAGTEAGDGATFLLAAAPTPTFTLRFTEWSCGHHGQRPDDIPCISVEQAQLILRAIGHAMSEPGKAVAALFDHRASFDGIHICADHADAIEPDANLWGWRSNLYCLTAEQFAALQTPKMKAAQLDRSGEPLPIWDGKTYLDDFEYITLLSPEEVQALCKPVEWHEVGDRSAICSAPPIIENGDWLASEIKDFADIRASKVGAA